MKKDIHPKYYPQAKVTCACGNTFTTGSTQPEIRVEICAQCHPFFTVKSKKLDIAGRVNKFEKKVSKAKELKEKASTKKVRAKKETKKTQKIGTK